MSENDFSEQVNNVVDKLIKGEDNKLTLPEDVKASQEVIYAAKIEKRRRDTQSSYVKSLNDLETAKKTNLAMVDAWKEESTTKLSPKQYAELEELKITDVDAYIEKAKELQTNTDKEFTEKQEKIQKRVQEETELERRNRILQEYNTANPKYALSDEVIKNDLPPKYLKQLSNGEITFDKFLEVSKQFLSSGKVVDKGTSVDDIPDLGNAGGNSTPPEEAITASIKEAYSKAIF